MAEELIDVVDERDVIIKARVSREEVHSRKLIHRSVIIFVFNSKGELFVQERSRTKNIYPGLFLCSASGHVSSGETYKETAVRELKEELGIDAKPKELERICDFSSITPKEKEMVSLFVLDDYDKKIEINRKEIASGKFISVVQLKKGIKENEKKYTPAFVQAFDLWLKEKKIFG